MRNEKIYFSYTPPDKEDILRIIADFYALAEIRSKVNNNYSLQPNIEDVDRAWRTVNMLIKNVFTGFLSFLIVRRVCFIFVFDGWASNEKLFKTLFNNDYDYLKQISKSLNSAFGSSDFWVNGEYNRWVSSNVDNIKKWLSNSGNSRDAKWVPIVDVYTNLISADPENSFAYIDAIVHMQHNKGLLIGKSHVLSTKLAALLDLKERVISGAAKLSELIPYVSRSLVVLIEGVDKYKSIGGFDAYDMDEASYIGGGRWLLPDGTVTYRGFAGESYNKLIRVRG
jgi:hypothetical protein